MINRLIQFGFIERKRDGDDRRVVKVKLTARGRAILKKLMQERRNALEKLLQTLNNEEMKKFLESIENVSALIKRIRD